MQTRKTPNKDTFHAVRSVPIFISSVEWVGILKKFCLFQVHQESKKFIYLEDFCNKCKLTKVPGVVSKI